MRNWRGSNNETIFRPFRKPRFWVFLAKTFFAPKTSWPLRPILPGAGSIPESATRRSARRLQTLVLIFQNITRLNSPIVSGRYVFVHRFSLFRRTRNLSVRRNIGRQHVEFLHL